MDFKISGYRENQKNLRSINIKPDTTYD